MFVTHLYNNNNNKQQTTKCQAYIIIRLILSKYPVSKVSSIWHLEKLPFVKPTVKRHLETIHHVCFVFNFKHEAQIKLIGFVNVKTRALCARVLQTLHVSLQTEQTGGKGEALKGVLLAGLE